MKTTSCKTDLSAARKRLCVETPRTLELLKHAGIQPRRSCNRLLLAAQVVAFLFLVIACADAALDAAVYEVDSAPRAPLR